ncbi:MAG: transcription termination/antitermination protein NusG [Hyphomicrobiaceae bacterium]
MWVVVNTHPHKERFAIENLHRQRFESYCPMLRARVRHARRTQDVLRPMFPGYLFTAVTSDIGRWRSMLSTFGVRSVVRNGDRLSYLPNGFVEALQAREVGGAIVRPASPFSVGQTVKVVQGAFDGIVATIVDMDERDRVVLLMELLQRPVKVTLDSTYVAEI